jgi:PKD repeat protein
MSTQHCNIMVILLALIAGGLVTSAPGTSAGRNTHLDEIITVDISDAGIIDVDLYTATVADLPGPDGHISLSEALIASNNTPGRQTIGFAIPTSDWTYLAWYYPGRAVIHGWLGVQAYDEVTIDGRTQTAFTGDTNPNGGEVVISIQLYLNSDNCTVLGLDSSSLSVTANNGLIEGNTATGIELFGGSGSLVRNNRGGYIQIDRSNNNVVVGNTVQRVRVLGWVGNNQPATNNRIGGPTAAERNYIIGSGTWNSQGWPNGFAVQIFDATGTVIENNQIGTTPDGLQQGSQATTMGIYFDGENHDTVIRNNRIAGILGHRIGTYPGVVGTAINVYGTGSGITIVGNKIGLNANDEPVLGSVNGITTTNYYIGSVQNVVIGGAAAGEGNEIAGHLQTGVSVANTLSGVRISGNSIHDNGNLGIDLITDDYLIGVTPNDPADGDAGGNGLQNFPVLLSAAPSSSGVTIQGTLDSSSNVQFAVEFFTSQSCDQSGFGEGAAFIGSTLVTTDGAGHAAFSVTLSATTGIGTTLTATATRLSSGATSEFSACIAATSGVPPVAKASALPTSGSAPLATQFSSAGSTDPDGTIASYSWNFGDGGSSTAANPSHTYSSAGTYTATLTVTDNNNSGASASVIINVRPPINLLLRSTAINLSATLQGKKVSVTGNVVVKDADGAAVSGALVLATWAYPGGGTATQTATTSSTGAAKFNTTGAPGTYTLTVTNITKSGYSFDAANSVLSKSITR